MQRFVKKIVDLMREEMLFSWQGGPVIMLQVIAVKFEHEYISYWNFLFEGYLGTFWIVNLDCKLSHYFV